MAVVVMMVEGMVVVVVMVEEMVVMTEEMVVVIMAMVVVVMVVQVVVVTVLEVVMTVTMMILCPWPHAKYFSYIIPLNLFFQQAPSVSLNPSTSCTSPATIPAQVAVMSSLD